MIKSCNAKMKNAKKGLFQESSRTNQDFQGLFGNSGHPDVRPIIDQIS